MSFLLTPKKKSLGEQHISGWYKIIDACGIIIQYHRMKDGRVFFERRDGVTQFNNDGFKVAKDEAKILGRALILHAELNEAHPNQKEIDCSSDFLEDLGKWMIESGGFEVH